MKKLFQFIFSLVFFWLMGLSAHAIPAYPGKVRVRQADGSMLTIQVRGDEFQHAIYTADGQPIMYNSSTGNYEYLKLQNGKPVSSGVVASDADRRGVAEQAFLRTVDRESLLQAMQAKVSPRLNVVQRLYQKSATRLNKITAKDAQHYSISDFQTKGKVRTLVILVQFSDRKFKDTNPHKLYNDKLNGRNYTQNGATGSVYDYYYSASTGQFEPEFVLVGPVTLSKASTYYGQNNSNDEDRYMNQFVKEAVNLATDSVDFSQFDTNNDGVVDNVYFIYAGYGEADSNGRRPSVIWPHSYYYSQYTSTPLVKNGKSIDRYTVSNELDGFSSAIVGNGTFIHEFGHVLGLADHYVTNYLAEEMIGEYDVMSAGPYLNDQNTPPTMSAFERAQLGWLELTQLAPNTDTTNVLQPLTDKNFAYAVSIPGNSKEGFIIENRQNKGWDTYLPGHGLLVWHIDLDEDAWSTNSVNNNSSHPRVDIVEANGKWTADGGQTFPGKQRVTQFEFKTWAGNRLFAFYDVKEQQEQVEFMLADGVKIEVPQPKFSEVTGQTMRAYWNKVDKATKYELKVLQGDRQVYDTLTTDTTVLLSGLTPETVYTVQLRVLAGIVQSDYVTATQSTAPLQFYERRAEALPPLEVSESSFTATWNPLPEADDYLLTVSQRTFSGQAEVSYDFGKMSAGFPPGWQSTSGSYGVSMYGKAAPALRLTNNEDNITFLAQGDSLIQSVSFWWVASRAENNLLLQSLDDRGQWNTIETIPGSTQPKVVSFSVSDTKGLRIVSPRPRNMGYVTIDDISLQVISSVDTPVPAYNGIHTGAVTQYPVTDLQSGATYVYQVQGLSRDAMSIPSNIIRVDLGNTNTAVERTLITTDAADEAYDLTGRKINLSASPKGVYLLRQGTVIRKIGK